MENHVLRDASYLSAVEFVGLYSTYKRRISTCWLSPVPCELWFLQAGRYATKEEKLLPATVCFCIEHARPPDAYVRTSNDITFVCFARNNSKTTTLNLQSHLFLYICLPFLYDYDVKMPNSGAPRARAKRARVGGAP